MFIGRVTAKAAVIVAEVPDFIKKGNFHISRLLHRYIDVNAVFSLQGFGLNQNVQAFCF